MLQLILNRIQRQENSENQLTFYPENKSNQVLHYLSKQIGSLFTIMEWIAFGKLTRFAAWFTSNLPNQNTRDQ